MRKPVAVLAAAILSLTVLVLVPAAPAPLAGAQIGHDEEATVFDVVGPGDGTYVSVLTAATDGGPGFGLAAQGDDVYLHSDDGAVRKIDGATGAVSVVVSGLNDGKGLAIYGDTLYLTRFHQGRIEALDLPSGVITVVDGACSYPDDVAVDANGNVYASCRISPSQDRIERVAGPDPVGTVAGGGSGFVDGASATSVALDGNGLATDAAGDVYIGGGDVLLKLDVSAGTIHHLAGGGSTLVLDTPVPADDATFLAQGLAVDADGAVYLASSANNRTAAVRFDPATDLVSRVVGGYDPCCTTGQAANDTEFQSGRDVVLTSSGDLYLAGSQFSIGDSLARVDRAWAGSDQQVFENQPVQLEGIAYPRPGRNLTGTSWTQVSGPAVTLVDDTTLTPTFTAPPTAGTVVLELTVTDDGAVPQPATDRVEIEVANQTPVVDAGPDQTVASQATVDLAGSVDDTEPVTTVWTQLSGTTVTLSDPSSLTPTFTAPDGPETLTFELSADDGEVVVTDQVAITVDNAAPVVDAGTDGNVDAGAVVALDGSATDVQPLTTTWTQVSGPAVTLSDPSALTPTFTVPLTDDPLVFELSADDGTTVSTDQVTLTPIALRVPVADRFGLALEGLWVIAYDRATGTNLGWDITDATGIAELPLDPGDVTFRVWDPAGRWRTEYFPDVRTFAASGTIPLTSAVVEASMTVEGAAKLSGRVVADVTTDPVAGAEVRIYRASGGFLASSTTDAEGFWEVPGLEPGDLLIKTEADGFVDEWYQDADTASGGESIYVGEGWSLDLSDAGSWIVLSQGAAVTGLVVDASTETALAGVEARLYYASGGYVTSTTSGIDGQWSFSGIQPGDYLVRLSKSGFLTEWYQDGYTASQGATLRFRPGSTLDLLSLSARARLTPSDAVALSGTVTDQGSGSPVAGAQARVYTAAGFVVEATTAADGTWSVPGLGDGTYYVRFSAAGYTNEWFDEAGASMNNCSGQPAPCTPSVYYATAIDYLGNPQAGIDGTLTP